MPDESKTEKPTPRHRQKAREQGQITRSRELTGALSMFAVAGAVYFMAQKAGPHWTDFYRIVLESASVDQIEPNGPLLFWTAVEAVRWIAPILIAGLVVSLTVGFAQGGFVFAPEALSFKVERLNPVSKLQQLFSPAGLSNILKSLIPFSAIGWVGVSIIRAHWEQIASSSFTGEQGFTRLTGGMIFEICWKSGLILLLWAGVDYGLLWMKQEGDLKMSREEVKEEVKQTDGNPATKSRIRKLQRSARRKMMLKATETATVVVTNPTHYAVALRYEQDMAAPIVVAKGLDLLAQKIKEIAWMRDIPVMENKPLAQALYKGVEVGDSIPAGLYQAVAEILVLVFKAQAEVKAREARMRAAARQQYATATAANRPTNATISNTQGESRPL